MMPGRERVYEQRRARGFSTFPILGDMKEFEEKSMKLTRIVM
jgi:hypothetical protein